MTEKIRKANTNNSEEILKLFNSSENLWYQNSKENKYNKKEILEYIKDKKNKMFVFQKDNKIVGVLLAEFHSDYIYLHTIVVDKDYRHQGIAKELMKQLEKEARKYKMLAIKTITEEKNKPVQALFKKLNYKKGKIFIAYVKST